MLFLLDQYTTQEQFNGVVLEQGQEQSVTKSSKLFESLAKEKRWDLPPFYISIHNRGWSSDFYQAVLPRPRILSRQLSKLTLDDAETKKIVPQILALIDYFRYSDEVEDDMLEKPVLEFNRTGNLKALWIHLSKIDSLTVTRQESLALISNIQKVNQQRTIWHALPSISWHGVSNRFHYFISEYIFTGRRISKVDGKTIYNKIWPAMGITVFINLLSLLVILLIGIPIGTWMYRNSQKLPQQLIQLLLYIFFALPLFWLATVILIVFGGALTGIPDLLPSEVPTVFTFLRPANWSYLILPVVTITLSLLAFVVIHLVRSLKETNEEKFILAARTKGLRENYITNKHNKPVSFYSIITLIGNSIPALISGSIVIEIIFNIPGMGRLLWQSLYAYDWNVVYGILVFGVLLSIFGQLLTDAAYYYFSPSLRAEL